MERRAFFPLSVSELKISISTAIVIYLEGLQNSVEQRNKQVSQHPKVLVCCYSVYRQMSSRINKRIEIQKNTYIVKVYVRKQKTNIHSPGLIHDSPKEHRHV